MTHPALRPCKVDKRHSKSREVIEWLSEITKKFKAILTNTSGGAADFRIYAYARR